MQINTKSSKVNRKKAFVLWFDEIGKDDVDIVGGKNANLGEMYQNLTKATKGKSTETIKVPYGFAVTAESYRYFIEQNELDKKIKGILKGLNTKDLKSLEKCGAEVREVILKAEFPSNLAKEIIEAYKKLADHFKISHSELDVAVRSSATAEDLPDASFAGQQESYLNVRGEHEVLENIKKAFSSLFTNRAISYRHDTGYDHFNVLLSVAVQKMVRSDRGSSGVMFTLDTESGFKDVILINASYGLGEYIVKGIITPDEYVVFKPALESGFKSIINKRLGTKEKKLVYGKAGSKGDSVTKEAKVPTAERNAFVLSDTQILQLSRWGLLIEKHYKRPMDIEWGYDSVTKQLFILQARPETIESAKSGTTLEEYHLLEKGKLLAQGAAVGAKIGQGKVHFIKNTSEIDQFRKGEVLVTPITDPDWEPIMKIASAIVTDQGGRTSHAAIVSRELGIPAVIGTGNATKVLKNGKDVTVSCAEGETGKIFEGLLKFKIDRHDMKNFKDPKTAIKMIVADPTLVFTHRAIPNRGVGLAREEFIISNFVKIHPNALIDYKNLHPRLQAKIDKLTVGYEDKAKYYVEKLKFGIATIAAAYYPYEVVLRFSDFKSNEYRNLIGGDLYEPEEENPMLGWRGASRYYDPLFMKAFELECRAVKEVRETLGLWNLKVMIPFCRTPEEGRKVVAIMESYGLKRIAKNQNVYKNILVERPNAKPDKVTIKSGLEIYVMAEIPSNVLQAEEFADIFDAFSIGSNDLTQLTLGLDRDSKLIAHIGSERSPAVRKLISELIKVAHKRGKEVGICGQGPSDFPDFAEFLVKEGIDSISINPDTVLKASMRIKDVEKKIGRK